MPYRSELSASPQERQPTLSPPVEDGRANGSGPSKTGGPSRAGPPFKRAKLTQADVQRIQVEKLLANPDREVALPQATKEKTLRAPYEMMKNVQGSAAGAGSGEFHVYKASRRREFERVKIMEDKARALEEQAAFQARQEARDAEADAKTAKNRAKRQKRKSGRKGDEKGNGASGAGTGSGGAGAGTAKRKLAGGAEGFNASQAGGREEEESADEEGDSGPRPILSETTGRPSTSTSTAGIGNIGVTIPSEGGAMARLQSEPKALDEPRVVIHDDD